MWTRVSSRRTKVAGAIVAVASLGAAGVATTILASDHQDTAIVEFKPTRDVNDVYAFPGSSPDRIALVVTVRSPITPGQSPRAQFGQNVLYQIKVDNDGDAVENLVFQITFTGQGPNQQLEVRGPVAPNSTGNINTLVAAAPAVSGPVNTVLGSPSDMQVFAGIRADPFFLDLEQFFRIIPDRKPERGPLSKLPETPTATSFRDPGVNYFAGINALGIVIELPVEALGATDGGALGFWATTSVDRN
ncbi:MAG: DUF4331 domain-containing protein [Gemmatimonadota bacterium]|nr:DUF4331 domain-containing protein [Gemmatimonadota bacterium]